MATALDHIEVRYRTSNPVSAWTVLTLGTGETSINIPGVTRDAGYQIEARAVGKNGAASVWVQQTHTVATASSAWALLSQPNQPAIGQASLIGEAPTSTTGQIEVLPFTYGGLSYFPSGSAFVIGLAQKTSYYVYVVDSGPSGGDLTPQVTQDQADFINQIGFFYIGSVTVPPYSTSGGTGTNGATFYPSSFQDVGTRSSQGPASAYDGNVATYATISGQASGPFENATETYGDCLFEDFPAIAVGSAATLSIDASVSIAGTGGTAQIIAKVGGAQTLLLDTGATAARNTHTLSIASGTDLSTISVEIIATSEASPGSGSSTRTTRVQVYEIFIS